MTVNRNGMTCRICGNGGPAAPGARYACGLPEAERQLGHTCPMNWPKEVKTMTPENVILAHIGLNELGEIDTQIMCAKSNTLTVVIGGKYYEKNHKEMQDAVRVGVLKYFYEMRAAKINELRALGVELSE